VTRGAGPRAGRRALGVARRAQLTARVCPSRRCEELDLLSQGAAPTIDPPRALRSAQALGPGPC